MIDTKNLVYPIEIGKNGVGVSVKLDGGEVFNNEDFDIRFYDVRDLNKKSKKSVGILFDILRSHISVDGKTHEREFSDFMLPLVVSKNFTPTDFLELWTTTALSFYSSFGFCLAWESVEKTAKNVSWVLDGAETEDYKMVHIFACNFELFRSLYHMSLVEENGSVFADDNCQDDLAKELPTRMIRESSKTTAEKSEVKKATAEAEAEKKEAEETADWNKKASMAIADHLLGKYFKGKNNDFKTTLEKEIQNILNNIK